MNRAHNTMDDAEAELGLYPHFSNLSNTGGEHAVAMHTIHPHLQQCPSNILQCMDQSGNIDAIRYIEYSKRRRVDFWNRANFICNMKSTLRQQRCQQLCQQLQLQRSACLSRSNSNAMHPTGRFSLVTPSSLTRPPAKMPTAAAAAAAANTNTNTNTSTNTGNVFSTASTPSSFSSGDDEKRTLIADMYRNGVEGLSARRNSNSNSSINSNPQSKIAPNIAARFMTPRSSSMPFVSSIAMKNTNLSPVGRNSSVIDEKITVVRTGTSTSSMHGDIKRGTNGHTKSNKNLATLSAEPQVQSLPLPTPTPVPTSPSQVQEEEKQQQQQHLPSQPHRHLEKDEIEAAEALLFGMGRNRSMSEVAVRSAPTHVSPSVTMESENRDDGHPSEHKGESRVGKKVRGQRQRQRRADRPKSRATKKRKGRDWSVTGMMMTPAMYDVCDGGESSTVVSAEGANNVVNKRRTHPKRKYTTIIIE